MARPARGAFLEAAATCLPDGATAQPGGRQEAFAGPLVRLRSPVIASLAQQRSACANDARAEAIAEPDEDELAISPDAATGTLVHRYLEMIANDGLAQWPAERCAALQPACEAWLRASA